MGPPGRVRPGRQREDRTAGDAADGPLGAPSGAAGCADVGFGISLTGTAHEDTADIAISIPHPFFRDRYAADGAETEDKLMRTEGGVHLQFVAGAPVGENVTVRVFGGPSIEPWKVRVGGFQAGGGVRFRF